jgi:hypothetical protein
MPVFADARTIKAIHRVFPYLVDRSNGKVSSVYVPVLLVLCVGKVMCMCP